MAQHPQAFNELAVSMVRAGQEGGFLEDVLHRIADFTEPRKTSRPRSSARWPTRSSSPSVGFLVLNALVIFFVPIFEKSLFAGLRQTGRATHGSRRSCWK